MTDIRQMLLADGGTIRYSAICVLLRKFNKPELLKGLDLELAGAGQTCSTHGFLEDPVILVEPTRMQLIVACPFCSSPELLARWEAQGEPSA